ncbi:DUF3224 domain-containing protein [Thalassotalea euphylliae]|uniref:DUF3224 domain-containing protein n=1 Tax=Thalassotalea euphylliae TaxID=1655234 RepID=A0A3E0TTR2_9GAMM|nr:DUF3224 domain-containing protein [Thalassotalea euphylliae]REL27830.1 DUF3224 domain-containing protein [Thalassotalea euphylliae]
MTATGSFSVKLDPQQDRKTPAGRMLISKVYSGDIVGTGIGQMISKRTESGNAVYYAIEEVSASLAGKKGTFTLLHSGVMSVQGQQLSIQVMSGSGTGELAGISGDCIIEQKDGEHFYQFNYHFTN